MCGKESACGNGLSCLDAQYNFAFPNDPSVSCQIGKHFKRTVCTYQFTISNFIKWTVRLFFTEYPNIFFRMY